MRNITAKIKQNTTKSIIGRSIAMDSSSEIKKEYATDEM